MSDLHFRMNILVTSEDDSGDDLSRRECNPGALAGGPTVWQQ